MKETPRNLSVSEREVLLRWCMLLESLDRGDFAVEKEILRNGYVLEYSCLRTIDDAISELGDGEDASVLDSEVSQEVAEETRAIFRMADAYKSAYLRLTREHPDANLREPDQIFRGIDQHQPHARYGLFVTECLDQWTQFADVMQRNSTSQEAPSVDVYREMVEVAEAASSPLRLADAERISELSKRL